MDVLNALQIVSAMKSGATMHERYNGITLEFPDGNTAIVHSVAFELMRKQRLLQRVKTTTIIEYEWYPPADQNYEEFTYELVEKDRAYA